LPGAEPKTLGSEASAQQAVLGAQVLDCAALSDRALPRVGRDGGLIAGNAHDLAA
jgi:hypothetical protein